MCAQVHACVWWQWKGLLGADNEVCKEKGGEGGRGSGLVWTVYRLYVSGSKTIWVREEGRSEGERGRAVNKKCMVVQMHEMT